MFLINYFVPRAVYENYLRPEKAPFVFHRTSFFRCITENLSHLVPLYKVLPCLSAMLKTLLSSLHRSSNILLLTAMISSFLDGFNFVPCVEKQLSK